MHACCCCREQATEQLKATRAGPEQTREMMEVLQRLHQQQQAAEGFDGSSSDQDSNDSSSEDDSDVDDGPEATTAASQLQHCPALKQLLKRVRSICNGTSVVPQTVFSQFACGGSMSY